MTSSLSLLHAVEKGEAKKEAVIEAEKCGEE